MDSPLHRRHYVVAELSHSKIIADFVESPRKSGRTGRTLEPQHRFYSLLDTPGILLKTII
jgi:hypothetical protein